MSLVGHVFFITDPATALAPILAGDQAPSSGFEPWPKSTVLATYFLDSDFESLSTGPIQKPPPIRPGPQVWSTSATVQGDGSFTLSEPPKSKFGEVASVTLKVTSGVPVYRTSHIPIDTAKSKSLDIWVFVDQLPTSDGITAGTVSQQVDGAGLPGNTTITAGGPNGLNFSGTSGQVSINFNILIAPDTSPVLTDFLDLSINGSNISVGAPTSWLESADEVLAQVTSGIASAGDSINTAVLAKTQALLLAGDPLLTPDEVSKFLNNEVSVTFFGISFPNTHSWSIGNGADKTVVVVANPCVGFPRNF